MQKNYVSYFFILYDLDQIESSLQNRKNHETFFTCHAHEKLFQQFYYMLHRYYGLSASTRTLTFTIIETWSDDVCNNWKVELLLEQWRTVARSIVSRRISIKVPTSRSYTRTSVKSVGLRTCAQTHVHVRSRTRHHRQIAFVYFSTNSTTCDEVEKTRKRIWYSIYER